MFAFCKNNKQQIATHTSASVLIWLYIAKSGKVPEPFQKRHFARTFTNTGKEESWSLSSYFYLSVNPCNGVNVYGWPTPCKRISNTCIRISNMRDRIDQSVMGFEDVWFEYWVCGLYVGHLKVGSFTYMCVKLVLRFRKITTVKHETLLIYLK